MEFFEEIFGTPENIHKANEAEGRRRGMNMMRDQFIDVKFAEFLKTADLDMIMMFVTTIFRVSTSSHNASFIIGKVYALLGERGVCPECFKQLSECLGVHDDE